MEPPKHSGKRGRGEEEKKQGAAASAKQGPKLSEDIRPEDVPRILGENIVTKQRELDDAESRSAFELSHRHPDEARKDIVYSFSRMPEVITSWKMRSVLNADIENALFTQIKSDGDDGGDLTEREAARWVPMVWDVDKEKYRGSPPSRPVRIAARNNSRWYDVRELIGTGSYGSVFLCTRGGTNEDVAIKFQRIDSKYMIRIPKVGTRGNTAKVISPDRVAGLFAHYVMQRAYGGCLPTVVCAKDIFMLATPSPPPRPEGQPLQWYMCIAMENMEGDLHPLVAQESKSRHELVTRMITIFGKMTRAIYDMELQSMFHNDIKPGNFLYSHGGAVIKVTDFDLTCFGSRIGGIGSNASLLLKRLVSHFTEGGLDISTPPWSVTEAKNLLKCQYSTTEQYAPPEYDLLYQRIESLSEEPHNMEIVRKYEMRTLHNSDWLSRMMAYQLVSSFRELALYANLNMPYYSKTNNSYTTDINLPESRRMEGVSVYKLIRMIYDGSVALAPSSTGDADRKLRDYNMMRRSTIVTRNLVDDTEKRVAKEFNDLVADVIAPCKPRLVEGSYKTYCDLDNGTMLCAPRDKIDTVRPTVPMLLKMITKWLHELKVLRPMPAGSPRIDVPAKVGEEFEVSAKYRT